jgi:hypothetical protein
MVGDPSIHRDRQWRWHIFLQKGMSEMTTIKFYLKPSQTEDVGKWLDQHLLNPPLPDSQRWTMIPKGGFHVDIEFENENDAMLFSLAWSDGNPPTRKVQ